MHVRIEGLAEALWGPANHDGAAMRGLTAAQYAVVIGFLLLIFLAFWLAPFQLGRALLYSSWTAFLILACWRLVLCSASLRPPPQMREPHCWPVYTIIAALCDEADVASSLVEALSQIDYPAERLEGFIVLEAHDAKTRVAFEALMLPQWLQVVIAEPGAGAKPRALNYALARSSGELVVIYDAEDDPDPLQLREAAARFMADPGLVALQAPLRIRRRAKTPSRFIDRQFAAEYAGLFEVTLRGMAALGLPFPLGGTSNHIRTDALKAVGGWDPCNLTEDADIGFRLWRRGGRLGVISRPTYETPPDGLYAWLPQRTRWLKGYLQTISVHTRSLNGLGIRGVGALVLSLGVALFSAALHGPALAWITVALGVALIAGVDPMVPLPGLLVLCAGAAAAWITCAMGAIRAGVPYGVRDMVEAPIYWALTSLAFGHAVVRLAIEPYAWDKTPHRADVVETVDQPVPADLVLSGAGRQAA